MSNHLDCWIFKSATSHISFIYPFKLEIKKNTCQEKYQCSSMSLRKKNWNLRTKDNINSKRAEQSRCEKE